MTQCTENRLAPRLIVNADDFGLAENVNRGIIQAHLEGIVTSASVMANGPALRQALELAASTPSLDLGIHLTLVGESPLCRSSQIPTLLGPDQRLLPDARSFLLRYLRGGIKADQLRRELEAQVVRILESGVQISHIDSHQHLHVFPGVLSIVMELAAKYGIRAVRWPHEALRGDILKESLRRPGRLAEMAVLRSLTDKSGVGPDLWRTDRFIGFFWGGRLSSARLRLLLGQLGQGEVTELMCHPGLCDPSSPYSHWGYDWAGELAALTSPAIRAETQALGIDLVGFREVEMKQTTNWQSRESFYP